MRFEEWREEQEEMWMWGCKRSRTTRSSIRMCWYHIFSEASAERFVFRARASPSCGTECVKMHCHDSARNQKQRCWRWLLVFLVGTHQSSYATSSMCAKTSFLDDNQEQQAKCECRFYFGWSRRRVVDDCRYPWVSRVSLNWLFSELYFCVPVLQQDYGFY